MARDWTEEFYWFHSHPEVSHRERLTTERIRALLEEEGVEVLPSGLKTGLVAVVRGELPGGERCLRADIDALPVEEQTGLPYASQAPGVMHACGHDFHITAGLAAASLLRRRRAEVAGTVYFAFQPAEEMFGGVEDVVATGALDGVTQFYAIHVDPGMAAGRFGISPGGVMAAVDAFAIQVKGMGAHGAMPHLGRNPVPVVAQLIQTITAFAGQRISAFHPHVVTFTQISGGTTWNVIPETAGCQGTVRTLDPEDRAGIRDLFHRAVREAGELTGTECTLEWREGPPAVVNADALCRKARRAAEDLYLPWGPATPAMTGDDFSLYGQAFPGASSLYIRVGTGVGHSLHHPKFQADPAALEPTARLLAQLLARP